MKFTNANSFKAKIKNLAKEKGLPPQQMQQIYLIEEVIRTISESDYAGSFIIKGGYLIGNMIGVDKRTTMDLDVTVKGFYLTEENVIKVFEDIFSKQNQGFSFELDRLEPIRKDDQYGGFCLKLNASFENLREVVFIDITTGDTITPQAIEYRFQSVFSNETIEILSYNLETILAEKLEAILSRGEASTRPRDRYDLFTLSKVYKGQIDFPLLYKAILNTFNKRGTIEYLNGWRGQVEKIQGSDYQAHLWSKYQKQFIYAREISFEESVQAIEQMMENLPIT